MTATPRLTKAELDAGLHHIRQAPKDEGLLALIVRRPAIGEREVLATGELDLAEGLVGDNWRTRGSSRSADGRANPETQLTIMNARAIAHIAQDKGRWPLAGDQLFIDMDISAANMPPGTRLAIGSAVVEVTPAPHNGCKKFVAHFGLDAMKWVNSAVGKALHLRGINARVLEPGTIRTGDAVARVKG